MNLGVNEESFSRNLITAYDLKSWVDEAEEHIYLIFFTENDKLFVLNAAITDFNVKITINRDESFCSTLLNTNLPETYNDSAEAVTFENLALFLS